MTANNKAEQELTLYKKELLLTRPFEVFTLTETGAEIKTYSGIKVKADFSIDNSPELDILIIPGGPLRAVQSITKLYMMVTSYLLVGCLQELPCVAT